MDAILPVPPVPVSAVNFASLPLWQRRYLNAIAAGLTEQEAELRANVVHSTIASWTNPANTHYDPVFARAEELVASGKAIVGAESLRAQALAYTGALLDADGADGLHAPHWRERRGARDAVYNVSGAIQRGPTVVVPVQVNVGVSRLDAWRGAPPSPAPPPVPRAQEEEDNAPPPA